MTLVRVAYDEQGDEVAGKAMDFSGPTIERRWAAGHRAMLRVVERLTNGSLRIDPGFQVIDID